MDRYFKYGLFSGSVILFALLSTFLIATPVSATSATPPPDSISVPQGGVFLLRGSITFDQPATGYFVWGPVYWYNNGDPTENFCLENIPSVYWSDGTPVENVSISDYAIVGGWHIVIGSPGSGIARNGTFYVDIWLRAASSDGTIHIPGAQQIYFEGNSIYLEDPNPIWVPAGPITVQVNNIIKLENLYNVGLEKDLKLQEGSKLVAKFYAYDNTLQAESVVDNITPPYPYFIKENENVPHPLGVPVEKVALVLTTDNTENEISTMASFTVYQSDLRTRYGAILKAWGSQPEQQDAFRTEVGDILRQWSSAPS